MKLTTLAVIIAAIAITACGGGSSDATQQEPSKPEYVAPNTANAPASFSIVNGEGFTGTLPMILAKKGTITIPQTSTPTITYTGTNPVVCLKPSAGVVSAIANVSKIGDNFTFTLATYGSAPVKSDYYIFDTVQGVVPMKVVSSARIPDGIVDDGKTETYSYPYAANDFHIETQQGSGVFAGCITSSKLAVRSFKVSSVQYVQGVSVDANGATAKFVGTEIFPYTQPDVTHAVGGSLLLVDVAGL